MTTEGNSPQPIFFYEHEYYVFSNFSSFAIEWKGRVWMTSEHVYHSEKFRAQVLKTIIFHTRSAHDALKISHEYRNHYRANWDEIKLGVMKQILRAKAMQHPYVMKKLLESGHRPLIEDSWRDDYWGWGPNQDGANHLGRLWMEVRDEVRNPTP